MAWLFKGSGQFRKSSSLGLCTKQWTKLRGQISREQFRMGGTRKMPITIRSPFGGGVHTPELHSDSLEGLVAQCPGLRVVIPSDPYDAKGLLISSVRSDDPVVFLEHMKLYRSFKQDVPTKSTRFRWTRRPLSAKERMFPSLHMVRWCGGSKGG